MNVLFLSTWYPYPPNNGSKLRIHSLLAGLAKHHNVTLLSFVRDETGAEGDPETSGCRKIITVPWKQFRPNSGRARLGVLSARPRAVVDTFSPRMAQAIEDELRNGNYDIVIASQLETAAYGHLFASTPSIFEEVEVGVLYEQYRHAGSLARRARYGLTWFKHRHYLSSLLQRFQAYTVVSEKERQLVEKHAGGGRRAAGTVVPNCIDVSAYAGQMAEPTPYSLIFTGSFTYGPNYEAMLWFVDKVFPLVQEQIPQVTLFITGNHADLPLPERENVIRTGLVDDIRPLLGAASVAIVPVWTGGGTRLKILEAMAMRTPVVSTSKGAEGLDVTANEHLLIADTPHSFSQAVLTLITERQCAEHLAENAYTCVSQKYNWPSVLPGFLQLMDKVVTEFA